MLPLLAGKTFPATPQGEKSGFNGTTGVLAQRIGA